MGRLTNLEHEDLITATEACAILRVASGTVARWATEGRLETVMQLPGQRGARLFRRSDVRQLASELLAEAEDRVAELRQAVAS